MTSPRSSQNETPLQRSWIRNRRIIISDDDEPDQSPQTQAPTSADAAGMAMGHIDAAAAEPASDSASSALDSSRAQRPRFEAEAEESNSHRRKPHKIKVTSGTIFSDSHPCIILTYFAESSECDDSFIATSCDESDVNAVDMYHSAVHGMRNAQAARLQLRACTTSCPVCAKFAAYLQHFI